jgi:hypothetical protein
MYFMTSWTDVSGPAFGVHVKLSPGIRFSHPADLACSPPSLTTTTAGAGIVDLLEVSVNTDVSECCKAASLQPWLRFEFAGGEGVRADWAYPVDFCAGIYRMSHISAMLSLLELDTGLCRRLNPNVLEVELNKVFWDGAYRYQYNHAICLSTDVLCVVTVNRVQQSYDVPIYRKFSSDEQSVVLGGAGNLSEMNGLLSRFNDVVADIHGDQDKVVIAFNSVPQLDGARYKASADKAMVHVGGLHFSSLATFSTVAGSNSDSLPRNHSWYISVLIPVHNGAKFLKRAFASLLAQFAPSMHPETVYLDVVIVDDGSVDGTFEVCLQLQSVFKGGSNMDVQVIRLDENAGIATALDTGLLACKYEFVCRLDCDDVCIPASDRIKKQAWFLESNPQIMCVGSQVILRNEISPLASSLTVHEPPLTVAAGIHTNPACVTWIAITQRCPLMHSSVMFRRSSVIAVGGYTGGIVQSVAKPEFYEISQNVRYNDFDDEGESHAQLFTEGVDYIEDYLLWLKLLMR